MMVAQGGFDKKEEVENPSEVLLNPSDPEATFRYKAGGRHLGYVGNVVEAVGEKSSLVIVYVCEVLKISLFSVIFVSLLSCVIGFLRYISVLFIF